MPRRDSLCAQANRARASGPRPEEVRGMASKRWWLVVAPILALCAANASLLTESVTDEREGCEWDRDEDTTAAVGTTRHGRELLATGQYLTPTAAPGSTLQFLAT